MPWLGLMHKVSVCDVYVNLDEVEHSHGSFENRQRVLTRNGLLWLTVPLKRGAVRIKDVLIDTSQPWQRKHWETIRQAYSSSEYWGDHREFLEWFYSNQKWESLMVMNSVVLDYLWRVFGFSATRTAQSAIGAKGSKTSLIVDVCKKVGAWKFVFGASGPQYVNLKELGNVEAWVQSYSTPGVNKHLGEEELWVFHHLLTRGIPETKRLMAAGGKIERLV